MPRDACFARTEEVPTDRAVGRIAAEMLTPYRPESRQPCRERLTGQVLDYLCSGVRAGMAIPDAADTTLDSVRVMTD